METQEVRRPHVIAWNLTKRCNLACAHCYISAGSWHSPSRELDTAECHKVIDQILEVNPSPMLILSGGEPLVRNDLEAIAEHAAKGGATVVVGTNGIGLTHERIASLKAAGVTGVAVSVDSLDQKYHDRFRHGESALDDTLAAVERLREAQLDFIIQTTVTKGNRHELAELAAWSAERGAVSFNVYFVVSTGRGEGMKGLSPEENESVLEEIVELSKAYRGRMLVRSKCQPQIMRVVHQQDPESPMLNYETRCPCGVQYCRITPEGDVTPCPYNPLVAGDLKTNTFGEIWRTSEVFQKIRGGELGGRCGDCEYRQICGGCRARAYADTGDYMATDESCVYQPEGDVELIAAKSATYGMEVEAELSWAPDAEARMNRIPSFVRGVVMKRVEDYAKNEGVKVITLDLLDKVRSNMPIDFSKKLPFFMKRD